MPGNRPPGTRLNFTTFNEVPKRLPNPACMDTHPARITRHMVASLGGFIAKKDNSMCWFETTSPYEQGVEWQGPTRKQPARCRSLCERPGGIAL